ncbi:MAG: cytochrome-c oxidase [Pseudomonadota bacterium]
MFHPTPLSSEQDHNGAGVIWLKVSILYLLVGICIGIGMGVSQNFTLRPVHAHVNLLGWATMAVAGLVYSVFPRAGASRLAKVHFWAQNIALPGMMVSLALVLQGNKGMVPLLAGSEILASVGILAFALNIFINVKRS